MSDKMQKPSISGMEKSYLYILLIKPSTLYRFTTSPQGDHWTGRQLDAKQKIGSTYLNFSPRSNNPAAPRSKSVSTCCFLSHTSPFVLHCFQYCYDMCHTECMKQIWVTTIRNTTLLTYQNPCVLFPSPKTTLNLTCDNYSWFFFCITFYIRIQF